jgi:hypothetical protein
MSDDARAVDGVLRSAAARAVKGNTAVAVARDDGSWWAVLARCVAARAGGKPYITHKR